MRIGVLGPLEVGGGAPGLGPRDRTVLSVLVLNRGSAVRGDTLAGALWGDTVPASAPKVLQGCIVRLRRLLGATGIETVSPGGYRLALHHDQVDVAVFEDLVARARDLVTGGQPDRARYHADRARELWRGDPYPDLEDWEPGAVARQRLIELRRDVDELRAEAALAAGAHTEVIADLQELVVQEPTRERRWVLLATAEYRCGRQADALETLRRGRRHLVAELGLDPGEEMVALERAVLEHDTVLDPPAVLVTSSEECPYPGLLYFDVEDAAAFHGREEAVALAVHTLDQARALVVVGPSGSGKSSLLRAGVVATLRRDGTRVHVTTPGPDPREALASLDPRPGDVLVLDQLEEAFEAEPDVVDDFVAGLDRFVSAGGRLVLGLRGDRMGELAAHAPLARLTETGLQLLGPMSAAELRRAVVGPAEQAGLRLEPGLVDLLVREVEGEPAALPLLSHVLRETWAVREGRTLTVAGYRSTGGVQSAVAQTAETLFWALGAADQDLLRQLMTRLVSTGEEGAPVRRRVQRRAIDQDSRGHVLIEQLIAARLLSTDGEEVEIAHESLTMAWPRLRSWLDDDVEGLRVMRHVAIAAESWEQLGRPDSELYRGIRLSRAVEWRARVGAGLTPTERDFLDASAALDRREQVAAAEQARRDRAANRRLRIGLAAMLVLAVAATAAGVFAGASSRRATDAAVAADARRLGAEALRAKDLDTSLLLAVAGVRLHDEADTRANLLATLDRSSNLIRMARVPRVTSSAVNTRTGLLLAQAPEEALLVRRADTLEPVSSHPDLRGPAVVVAPDGGWAAVTLMPELVSAGASAVVILGPDGQVAPAQLGGIPTGHFAQQDIGVSADSRWLAATLRPLDGEAGSLVGVWDMKDRSGPTAILDLGERFSHPVVAPGGLALWTSGAGSVLRTTLPDGHAREVLTPADLDLGLLDDAFAVAPDGRTAAVAAGAQVALVDLSTPRVTAVMPMAGGAGRLAFSADGRLLAASGDDLVVWSLGGEEPAELLAQEGGGDWPAFDASGGSLVTSALDGLLFTWDLSGSRGFLPSVGGTSPVGPFARLSPDATWVLRAGGAQRPVFALQEAGSGAMSEAVDLHQDLTSWLDTAWSTDGRLVSVPTGDDVVTVWDAATRTEVARRAMAPGEGVTFVVFTPDGTLAAATTMGRVHLLDQRTLEPRRAAVQVASTDGPAPPGTVSGLHLRPGTTQLVADVDNGERVVLDTVTGESSPLDLGLETFGLAYSPDGTRLAVTTREGGVGLWDVEQARWVAPVSTRQPFAGWDLTFAADGSEWATIASGAVGRFDGRTGDFLGSVTIGTGGAVGYTPDSRTLVIAEDSGPVRRWTLDARSWLVAACSMAGRDLTDSEWRDHLPGRDPVTVCGRA